jgi:hypothetical protein
MKNLIYISPRINAKYIINRYLSRAKYFCEQVKVESEQNEKQNTKEDKNEKKNKIEPSILTKGLDKFRNLWKHTFNYTESIEDKIEKRKQEAIVTKEQYKELSAEEIDAVIYFNYRLKPQ